MSKSNNFIQYIFSTFFLLILSTSAQGIIFNSPRLISLSTAQSAIVSADLNKDGIPDLIIGGDPLGDEQGKIRVLLGNGNGTFKPPTAFQVGFNPSSIYNAPYVSTIKVADLNGDGNPDIVAAHNGVKSIANRSGVFATVLFGEGNGNLRPDNGYVFVLDQSAVVVNSIDFADFNNDGRLDVVLACAVGSSKGNLYFLKNLGGDKFQAMGPKTIGANIYEVAAADVNNDSYSDLIMTAYEGVFILHGAGNFFSSNTDLEQRDTGVYVQGLAVKDFNGDGKIDFAVVERANKSFHVFLNGENGYPVTPVAYNTNALSDLIKSADINGDGKPDLIISDNGNGNLQVFYGSDSGEFGGSETILINLPVSDFTFADFDSNGKTDIAASLLQDPPYKQAAVLLNAPNPKRYFADFDGDGKSDVSVFRPSDGVWYLKNSRTGFNVAAHFGIETDKIVPADYDGDGKTDIAVYRNGTWYVLRSSDSGFSSIQFGLATDIPQPADFDSDGRAEVAVYRPSNGTWYVLNLANQAFNSAQFGLSMDMPVTADYDGDGKSDYAVYRPSNGVWYILQSIKGFSAIQFGVSTDKPVVGDYDGDGKADEAVYRPGSGMWYLFQSTKGFASVQFGISTDSPVAADYDGDGKDDIAVNREGIWYQMKSMQGFGVVQFGLKGDQPIPNAFIP